MIEVHENKLKLVCIALSLGCGHCPIANPPKGCRNNCEKVLWNWLTEKPIGYDVENDGK